MNYYDGGEKKTLPGIYDALDDLVQKKMNKRSTVTNCLTTVLILLDRRQLVITDLLLAFLVTESHF